MRRKVLLPLAAIALSTSAFAAEESMTSLGYRVKAGEFHYDLGMEFGKPKYNTSEVNVASNTAANTEHRSFENSKTTWTNEITYGVSDALSFGLGLDFALTNTMKQTSDVVGTTAQVLNQDWTNAEMKNSGLKSVDLNTSYRYLNGEVKADLNFGLSLSGKGKKAAGIYDSANNKYSGVSKGNGLNGGSEVELGTVISGKMSSFEWSGLLGLKYNLKKKYTLVNADFDSNDKNHDVDQEIKSNMDINLGVAAQYDISSAFAVGLSLEALFAPKDETSYAAYVGNTTKKNFTEVEKSHTDITLGLNLKYNVLTNLMVGVDYSHLFAADVDTTKKEVNGSSITNKTGKMTDRKADMFGFNIAYRF